MAYIQTNFVEFEDIKLVHFHGKSHTTVMPDVEAWINANPTYRFLTAFINYLAPPGVCTPVVTATDEFYTVEVTIAYMEG